MSRITITASDVGFFTNSPIDTPLAPNVFLRTGVNEDGTVLSFDGIDWTSEESLRYADQDIIVTAATVEITGAQLGQTQIVTVTSINYCREVDGEMVLIGTLELPEPIQVTATLLSYGPDDIPAWHLDLGTSLEDLLQIEGFDFIGGAGDDYFAPHTNMLPFRGVARIDGGAGNDHLTGTLGKDIIKGGTGDDVIYDPDGINKLRGGSGDDSIETGDGSDGSLLHGGSGNDTLISGRGSDILQGGSGHDTLLGGFGDDSLFGNGGRDILDGGNGDDIINGGRGKDILTGGAGDDVFVFNTSETGRDVITDFENGADRIEITGLLDYSDLTISQEGDDVWIDYGNDNNRIILEDTDMGLIGVDDFSFV